MAHSILTPTVITNEALRILHDNLNFIGNCNRQYDDRFARTGAKIGQTLNIRMPSKYTVRTNATFAGQDHIERSTPLSVSSQYGVDISFTTVDLTMNLDDFSERFIKPAMSVLATKLESDALAAAYKLVPNYVGATNADMTFKTFQQGGQVLTENLAPASDRVALLNPRSRVEFLDATKTLFQDQSMLAKQFREGMMGRTGGFTVFENNLLPQHTRGSLAGSAVTSGTTLGVSTTANSWSSQTTISVTGATSNTTLKAGDVITLGSSTIGLFDVHPETKANLGRLKKFVVQSDVTLTTAATNYPVVVKPALIYGTNNAFKNCVLSGISDTSGLTVTAFGVASTAYGQNLQFHKDAFVFASADLEDVSAYGVWGARASMDGISMRLARQYNITDDSVPCRIDVLWGFGGLYPEEYAVRSFHQLT